MADEHFKRIREHNRNRVINGLNQLSPEIASEALPLVAEALSRNKWGDKAKDMDTKQLREALDKTVRGTIDTTKMIGVLSQKPGGESLHDIYSALQVIHWDDKDQSEFLDLLSKRANPKVIPLQQTGGSVEPTLPQPPTQPAQTNMRSPGVVPTGMWGLKGY